MALNFDVAGLSFAIDSSQAQSGADNLDKLSDAADRAQRSHDQLILTHQRFIAASRDLSETLAVERRQFQETQATLAGNIAQMERLRDIALQTTQAFAGFSQIRAQVEALGAAYAQSSVGVELFQQRSEALNLSAGESTLALTRITDAVQGNSPQGNAIRGVLQQLGINPGSDPNQAGAVLQQFYQSLQGYADGPGKFRTVESVLGPLSPSDYAAFTAPSYEPLGAQYGREASTRYTTDIASSTRAQDLLHQQNLLRTQRLGDETLNYDIANLSSAQRDQLARRAGVSRSDLNGGFLPDWLNARAGIEGFGGRIGAYDFLRQHPNDTLAQGAQTGLGQVLQGRYRAGGLPDWISYELGTRSSSLASVAGEQFSANRTREGLFPAIGDYAGDIYDILTRQYQLPAAETRPTAPLGVIQTNPEVAATLAGLGSGDLFQQQAATARLRQLQDPATARLFSGAYGGIGASRLATLQASAANDVGLAGTAGGQLIYSSQQEAARAALDPASRSQFDDLLRFTHGNINPTAFAGRNFGEILAGSGLAGEDLGAFQNYSSNRGDATYGGRAVDLGRAIGNQGDELAALAGAGADPVARARALRAQQIRFQVGALPVSDIERRALGVYLQTQSSGAGDLDIEKAIGAESGRLFTAGTAGAAYRGDAGVTDQLRAAFGKIDPSVNGAVAQFEKLATALENVGRAAQQATFDAQNFGQGRDLRFQRDTNAYLATLPPSQRGATERALQYIQPQLSTNPIFGPLGVGGQPLGLLDQTTTGQVDAAARAFGLDQSFAELIARNEGASDPHLLNAMQVQPGNISAWSRLATAHGLGANASTRGGNINLGVAGLSDAFTTLQQTYPNNPERWTQANAAAIYNDGLGGTGVRHFIETGDNSALTPVTRRYVQNVTGPSPGDALATARQNPALAGDLAGFAGVQASSERLASQAANENVGARFGNFGSVLSLLSQGKSGAASIAEQNYADPSISDPGARAADQARRVEAAQRDLARAMAEANGEITTQTRNANDLAAAWGVGYGAVRNATIQQRALALAKGDPVAAQRLVPGLTQQDNAQQQQDAAQAHFQSGVSAGEAQYNLSLGIGPQDEIDRLLAARQAQDTAALRFPTQPGAQQQFVGDAATAQQLNFAVDGMVKMRDAAKSMGDAVIGSTEQLLRGGETFKRAVGGLFENLADTILQTAFQKPLENLFSGIFGSVLGTGSGSAAASIGNGSWLDGAVQSGGFLAGLSNFLGFGGGAAADAAVGGGAWQIGGTTFARGGAFGPEGPIRYNATGNILSVPTTFRTADGARNVGGEAGYEGLLPLRVMPNGSLGVDAANFAGGGGPNVTVHAPVIIQGGNGAGGAPDQTQMAAVQRQFEQMAKDVFTREAIRNQRPGGVFNRGVAT